MIRRLILILFFTLGTLLAAMAQNSIDRQVERYSAIGQSRFTSAVERDPRTRRVQKVVKVLELYDKGVKASLMRSRLNRPTATSRKNATARASR